MLTTDITISNKLGLHARAASKLANTAGRFACAIQVTCKGKTINGKSIMSLMLLAASQGTPISISTEGSDEAQAMDALVALINAKFDEGE